MRNCKYKFQWQKINFAYLQFHSHCFTKLSLLSNSGIPKVPSNQHVSLPNDAQLSPYDDASPRNRSNPRISSSRDSNPEQNSILFLQSSNSCSESKTHNRVPVGFSFFAQFTGKVSLLRLFVCVFLKLSKNFQPLFILF